MSVRLARQRFWHDDMMIERTLQTTWDCLWLLRREYCAFHEPKLAMASHEGSTLSPGLISCPFL